MPSGKAQAEQVKEKMQKIKDDQSLLIQWAEEKVQLAMTGHQLLEKYAHSLEGDIASLTQYLTETGQLVDEYMPDEYGVNHEPHLYDNVTSRRAGSSRPGYTSSMDGAVEMQEQSELCCQCRLISQIFVLLLNILILLCISFSDCILLPLQYQKLSK
jgi:hypothetical protein